MPSAVEDDVFDIEENVFDNRGECLQSIEENVFDNGGECLCRLRRSSSMIEEIVFSNRGE